MSDSFWLFLDRFSIVCGLLAFVGTGYSACMWMRHQRREKTLRDLVPVHLVSADDGRILYRLPYQPPRRLVTRAEVLGLLGMIPSRQQRFDWGHLHSTDFMRHLDEIHQASRHSLEIPVSIEEFGQLDLPAATRSPS